VGRLTRGRAWWSGTVGRRGEFLLFLTLLDLLYGLSLLRPAAPAQQSPSSRFLAEVMPLPAWGGIWLVVGLICLGGAFGRCDRLAYTCAAALKVLWGAMFGLGWLAGEITRGWVAAIIWLVFAVFVMRIASWPEPQE